MRERGRAMRLLLGPKRPSNPNGLARVAAFFGTLWTIATSMYLVVASLVALSRPLGGSPSALVQPLHATFPLLLALAIPLGAIALLRRRGLQFLVAAALAITLWFTLAPARRGPAEVSVPADAVRFTLLQANVFFANAAPAEVAKRILQEDADVVALEELSAPIDAALRVWNVYDRYPNRRVVLRENSGGAALLSKFAFEDVTGTDAEANPAGIVEVRSAGGGRARVRIDVVHPFPPLTPADNRSWLTFHRTLRDRIRRDLSPDIPAVSGPGRSPTTTTRPGPPRTAPRIRIAPTVVVPTLPTTTTTIATTTTTLPPTITSTERAPLLPTVVVGDFNATRWQPAFGAVLGAGATDLHEALGKGMSTSWPVGADPVPPFVRLDHAIYWGAILPISVRDVITPGSDHRGFVATLAVPRIPEPAQDEPEEPEESGNPRPTTTRRRR